MDSPDQKFTMNMPLHFEEVANFKFEKPNEFVSLSEVIDEIVKTLQFLQERLLRAKRNGKIQPEVTKRGLLMQRYEPPGSETETMLQWEPRLEEEWFGVIQHYLLWLGNQDRFGVLNGNLSYFGGKQHENAIYGLIRLLAEHAESVLASDRLKDRRYLEAKADRFVKSIVEPIRRGQIRLQIASIYPPERPMKWLLGGHRIELRRVTQADLDGGAFFRELNPGTIMPDCLCFVEGDSGDTKLRNIGDVIVTAARLFANADPDVLRDEFFTDDLCHLLRRSIRWHERRPWRLHPLILDSQSATAFIAFTKALFDAIGTDILFRPSWTSNAGQMRRSDPTHWLQISADRYNDALRTSDLFERKIASAVMSIESLILKPGEKSELLYRVSMRCAVIGDLLGLDSREIRRTAGRAYDIRSKFVHGGIASSKEVQKLDREFGDHGIFEDRVITLNRFLLLVATFSRIEKEDLVNAIDDAMIFPASRNDLRKRFQRVRPFLNEMDVLRPMGTTA